MLKCRTLLCLKFVLIIRAAHFASKCRAVVYLMCVDMKCLASHGFIQDFCLGGDADQRGIGVE